MDAFLVFPQKQIGDCGRFLLVWAVGVRKGSNGQNFGSCRRRPARVQRIGAVGADGLGHNKLFVLWDIEWHNHDRQ